MEKIEVTFEHQTIEVNKNTTYLEISKESKKRDSVLASQKK